MEKSLWRIIRRFSSHHKTRAPCLGFGGEKKQPSSNCLDSLVYQLKLVELDMMLTRCCKASASCQGPPAHTAAFAKAPLADYVC